MLYLLRCGLLFQDALPPPDIEVNFITNKNAPLKSSVLPVSAITWYVCANILMCRYVAYSVGLDEMISAIVSAAKVKRQQTIS